MSLVSGAPAAALLTGKGVVKDLGKGTLQQRILHGVSLEIFPGELVALTGTSGSGKSTLLYLMGALDKPTEGTILYRGVDLGAMSDQERAFFRGASLGYVFQFHFLLAEYTVLENVSLPLLRQGVSRRDAEKAAKEALASFGLDGLQKRLPNQLSGGQQQRVAIARAIAHRPAIILADEPTGSLDERNATAVFAALRHLTRTHGTAVLMVTHDPQLAAACDRTIALADGRIVRETRGAAAALELASKRELPSHANTGEALAVALQDAEAADAETIMVRAVTDAAPDDDDDDDDNDDPWSDATTLFHRLPFIRKKNGR